MTPTECLRESDVLEEIGAGRWPDQSAAALREHVASCPVCGDLALVVSGLQAEGETARAAIAQVTLPSAGQVWWRAELRARQEKAQLAQRPIMAVQVVAAVALVLAIGSGVVALMPGAWHWLSGSAAGVARVAADAGTARPSGGTLLVLLAVAFWLVVAPLAVVMVLRADRQGGR